MNDSVIRKHFHERVLRRYHAAPDVLVLDELGLMHGKCRADIALVNGRMIGYEIKSDEDSLDRLEEQVVAYSAVFDRATIIVGQRHLKSVKSKLPKWWGIIVGHWHGNDEVRFKTLRSPNLNRQVKPYALAQLLWSNEASALLKELGEPVKMLRQRRSVLYERLVQLLSLAELRRRVTRCLKLRKNWRSRAPLFPSDDSFQLASK